METNVSKTRKRRGRTAAQEAKILERGKRIFELRKTGASLRRISDVLTKEAASKGEDTRGFSYSQVRFDFKRVLEVIADDTEDQAREYRILLTEQLEETLLYWSPYSRIQVDALTPDNLVRMRLKSGDVVVKIVRELAELYGVKKPQKLEMSGPDGQPLNVVTTVIIEPVVSNIPKPEMPEDGAGNEA